MQFVGYVNSWIAVSKNKKKFKIRKFVDTVPQIAKKFKIRSKCARKS